jgi:hypothetical protein
VKVIVDTSIWSLALRRRARPEDATVATLRELVGAGLVLMLGCIRQEILSGIRSEEQFQILRDQFRAFPDERLQTANYERATKFFYDCRPTPTRPIAATPTRFSRGRLTAGR